MDFEKVTRRRLDNGQPVEVEVVPVCDVRGLVSEIQLALDCYDARDHRTTQPIHEALGALHKIVECEE